MSKVPVPLCDWPLPLPPSAPPKAPPKVEVRRALLPPPPFNIGMKCWERCRDQKQSFIPFVCCCLLGKSLSDDQTSNHQYSAQSQPGTLERQTEGTQGKEASAATNGVYAIKYMFVRGLQGPINL